MRCGLPPPAPPYSTSVALLRSATSCFGCNIKLFVSLVLTAAALDQNLRLEIDAAAFDIVAYMVAVFFGGEPRDSEFAAVDAQPRNVHGFRRCGVCDLNDLLKVFVGLRLARARVSLKKVLILLQPRINRLL